MEEVLCIFYWMENIRGNENVMKKEFYSSKTDVFLSREYKLLIGADFVPTKSNKELFISGNEKELFGMELSELFTTSDATILNLEAPITETDNKIQKEGSPNLKTYPEIVNILKKIPNVVLSGANNHIYDYSQVGIEDTINCLNKSEIRHVGFESDASQASGVCFLEFESMKIGIYACSEKEFCCADENRGGGNGYDPLTSFDEIANARNNCDYLIVLFHGGRENYRYPSVQLKRVCMKMVDSGANIVVCQHSHCLGTYEIYKESVIMYGQGNVLFDYNDIDEWKTSVLIEVSFNEGKIAYRFIPIEKKGEKVAVAESSAEDILNNLEKRSERIQDINFLKKEYLSFCEKQKNVLLLRGVLGVNSKLILAINKMTKGKVVKRLFDKKHRLLLLNYLRCESIREAIMALLENGE